MIELTLLVYFLSGFFAYIGFTRGWTQEVIALSGIILGLFAVYQFDPLTFNSLGRADEGSLEFFGNLPSDQKFYLQTVFFLLIVMAAYQTRVIFGRGEEAAEQQSRSRRRRGRRRREPLEPLQSRVLGGIVGFINGYLVSGTIWWFLEVNVVNGDYPLAPFIISPPPGSASATAVSNLPLTVLTQGNQTGDLLSIMVVVVFVIVLVLI
jgi:hypothetical protein